jgi:hypothetical protein
MGNEQEEFVAPTNAIGPSPSNSVVSTPSDTSVPAPSRLKPNSAKPVGTPKTRKG